MGLLAGFQGDFALGNTIKTTVATTNASIKSFQPTIINQSLPEGTCTIVWEQPWQSRSRNNNSNIIINSSNNKN